MKKKDFIVVLIIVVVAAGIAALLNWVLSIKGFIPTIFSSSEWLLFWATYLTGIFALIVGYLAISFGNRNSEKALNQQTKLLAKQQNDQIKSEILNLVKQQYLSFNVLNHCSLLLAADYDDIPGMIKQLVDDRARVHNQYDTWNFFVQLNLQSSVLAYDVNGYQKCLGESMACLDTYLKLQIECLQKIREVDNDKKAKEICDQILVRLNDEIEINKYKVERDKQLKIEDCVNEKIKVLLSKIYKVQQSLIEAQGKMEKASIAFLNKVRVSDFINIEVKE